MYCINCGVELQKGAKVCPLCGTKVYHPDIQETPEPALYPRFSEGEETFSPGAVQFILGFVFFLPIVLCLMIDLNMNHGIVWSGFVCCGLASLYIAVCLPLWFKRKNPVIFVPVALTALLLTALYISLKTHGGWFLSFAFPVGGALILLVEAIIVLCRYTVGAYPHRLLYIFGGAVIILGGLLVLLEFLIKVTFDIPMIWWSIYPLTALVIIGVMMIIVAANKKLRRSLHKKLFI
ncbi:MAG: zinc ribbon domain-containing protein [Firmicutes bacterium]|nr:zinc ribbon domain-containing protein [Bacillota bacterium]